MILSQTAREAISRCVAAHIPFAVTLEPYAETIDFYAGDDNQNYSLADGDCFMIGFFDKKKTPVKIHKKLSANQILEKFSKNTKCEPPEIRPIKESTDYADYASQAKKIIDALKANGGKTVLSRVIAVKTAKEFTTVIDEYFEAFPATFRFVYYTPQTGLWFGATPELLLDYDSDTKMLYTMSLAGTRKISESGTPWDEKNIREHDFVTRYIISRLQEMGIEAEIYDSRDLKFGSIEHLCDRIRAKSHAEAIDVIAMLSPTPALCGYPQAEAYTQINENEKHKRHCYGGWLAVKDAHRTTAYVNLRSAFVEIDADHSTLYNIYAGGGLTSESEVEREWQETEAKASVLFKIITQ